MDVPGFSRAARHRFPPGHRFPGRGRFRADLACLALAGVLWGTGGLLGSLLGTVAGLSLLWVAACRLLAGGVLLLAFPAVRRGRPAARPGRAVLAVPSGRAAWRRIAVTGALSAVFQGCYFAAIACTGVSLATLVTIGGTPVIVTAAGHLPGRRPARGPGAVTLTLALAGLGLLAGFPGGGRGEAAVLAGTGLSLLSAAAFAAFTLLGSSPVPGLGDLTVSGYGFVLGGLALLPLAAVTGTGPGALAGLSPGGIAAAAALALALAALPTAAAYALYYRGLRTAPAASAALLSLLEPLTAAVLAALFLHDRLGLAGTAGAVLLLAALARAAFR
jgi:DME family drug/metabolite transporter